MLGPIGASLMSIMRVLTPAEIEFYLERASSDQVVPPVAVGAESSTSDYLDQNKPNPALLVSSKEESLDNNEAQATQNNVITLFPEEEISPVEVEDNLTNSKSYKSIENTEISEKSNTDLESIGVFSSTTIKEQKRQKELERKKATPSASVFLITERLKLKDSQQKMKEQVALKNYKQNSVLEFIKKDIEIEVEDEESSFQNGVSGILVNKKQN